MTPAACPVPAPVLLYADQGVKSILWSAATRRRFPFSFRFQSSDPSNPLTVLYRRVLAMLNRRIACPTTDTRQLAIGGKNRVLHVHNSMTKQFPHFSVAALLYLTLVATPCHPPRNRPHHSQSRISPRPWSAPGPMPRANSPSMRNWSTRGTEPSRCGRRTARPSRWRSRN